MDADHLFPNLERRLDLFKDNKGIWRCGGRMANADLCIGAQNPILLKRDHHLTSPFIFDAHKRVAHNGVRETLAELRSLYWVIRGRQTVKRILHSCVNCRRYEGLPCKRIPPPPLPSFRVNESRPFQTTGVDFAGPLYVRSPNSSGEKSWIVLYTCYVTRAVHLDVVQDMSTETLMRSLRRFAARRGTPARIVSDNAKTFKSTALTLADIFKNPESKQFLEGGQVEWKFNLEKAPWQGGAFERMVRSAKRCLRKSIGKRSLTLDELSTLVIEVEGVLNSRPLTYVTDSEVIEPLTPSHLLVGYRLLTLPDGLITEDPAEDYLPSKLTRRANHLSETLKRFWRRWKREYLLELREIHRNRDEHGSSYQLEVGDIVTVFDENHPRGI